MSVPYPKRDSFFATKFLRLTAKAMLANRVGADGVVFLHSIAACEDELRYSGPVQLPQVVLQAQAGIKSKTTFLRVRQRLVDAGWLAYVPGTKSQAPSYWVTIPPAYQGLFGVPLGAVAAGEPEPVNPPNEVQKLDPMPTDEVQRLDQVRSVSGPNSGPKTDPYNPTPITSPKSSASAEDARERFRAESVEIPPELDTPAFREAWGDWIKHRREKGARLTPLSVKRQFMAFIRAGPSLAVRAINLAIEKGWTGVFPERVEGNGRSNEARNNAGASYQPRSGPRKI